MITKIFRMNSISRKQCFARYKKKRNLCPSYFENVTETKISQMKLNVAEKSCMPTINGG